MDSEIAGETARRIVDNVRSVVRDSNGTVELAVATLLAGGHLLVEGIPGVGKTVLARALAASVHGSLRRVQATPDLMPSDVTGISVYNRRTEQFEFVPGPIFANIVLVDEVNRTPPRTQSALMEAMSERRVTVEGETYELPDPFFVIATQNPRESYGTYPLPEGQLDRFAVCLAMGRLDRAQERDMLREQVAQHPLDHLAAVVNSGEVAWLAEAVRAQHVSDAVLDYALAIVHATRTDERIHLGVSSRGAATLLRLGQARALLGRRGFVLPDDVKALAVPALAHRLVLESRSLSLIRRREVLAEIVSGVPVPLEGGVAQTWS